MKEVNDIGRSEWKLKLIVYVAKVDKEKKENNTCKRTSMYCSRENIFRTSSTEGNLSGKTDCMIAISLKNTQAYEIKYEILVLSEIQSDNTPGTPFPTITWK